MTKAGWSAIILAGWTKTLIFIVLAPLIGMSLGFALMVAILWIFQRARPAASTSGSGGCSSLSAAAYSLGHGGNDAQKTMGIIAGALVAGGYLQLDDGHLPIPIWVVLAAHAAIALGTLSGGWRIIHTMGSKITKLTPVGGFAAETAGAISLFTATHLGVPVSTTHTITGAIIGVGSIRRLSAVRWGIAGRIVWAWILTIPAAAFIAAVTYWVIARHARALMQSSWLMSECRVLNAEVKGEFGNCPDSSASASHAFSIQNYPGSSIVNTAPPSGRFATDALPPCSSMRCLTMARPRPVPPGSRVARVRDLSTR